MAVQLVVSTNTAYLTHIGAANSFFSGIANPSELGNLASSVGASTLTEMYANNAQMQWSGPVEAQSTPTNETTGQYAIVNTLTAVNDLGADYECRRGASVITTGGRIQRAISTNASDTPLENTARFCLYYPSEDFNQEVLVHDYNSTDINDVNGGNNISELLANITGRMNNFSGNNGPVCTGVLSNDLLDSNTNIFKLGCLLTWETSATAGEAIIVMAGN
jgi:hypothetical protein